MSDSLLSPRLRGLLARSRFRLNAALPAGGQGDRSSRAKGSGLEFAEHRPYQPGDDLKHIDPHLEARLGETFIRQYHVDAQMPVTIFLDTSASMATGDPGKLPFSTRLAAALSYLALSGNDRVRLAELSRGQARWTDWFSGERNIDRILAWLSELKAQDRAQLQEAAVQAASRLPPTGLIIVVSDWQAEDSTRLPVLLAGEGRELICVHVHTPEEENPELLQASGDLRLVDAETGEELDVALNPQALAQYREAWELFTDGLREQFLKQRALYVPVSSDADVEQLLLREWTRLGLILR